MKKFLGFILSLPLLTGCSDYALVNSSVYNNADLADYHTFRIVTPDQGQLPPGMQMVTYYNIAAAVREQLVDRGFTEDPTSPILVNIGVTVKKQADTQAFTTPGVWVNTPPPPPPTPVPVAAPGFPPPATAPGEAPAPLPGGPHPAGPPVPPPPAPVYNGLVPYFIYPRANYIPGNTQIVTSVYREGVLTMDIVDMQTKLPLYSSSVATILDAGDTQFRDLSGIAQAVDVLFSKFPVPLLPQYKK